VIYLIIVNGRSLYKKLGVNLHLLDCKTFNDKLPFS